MIPQMGHPIVQLTHPFEKNPLSLLLARTTNNSHSQGDRHVISKAGPLFFHDYPCLSFDFFKGDKDCPNFNSVEIDWNWD